MTAESIFQEIKDALSGRPGQAIVLGVCQALATRFRQEVWLVRLVTIVFAIVWTLLSSNTSASAMWACSTGVWLT